MKSKFEGLPRELYEERICSSFKSNSKELSSLALTNKAFYTLFQPKRLIDTLLHHVAWGNQDAAEKMLKKSPELMIKKGSIIDPSRRYFKNISAFELVLWTLDVRYMATMMLNCLPNDATGLKIAKALKAQYEYFDTHGVTYTLDNQTITEKHFDFSELIYALHTYVDNYDNWNEDARREHWCTKVGRSQRHVPAHVIQHYCDPETPFEPIPTFTAKQFGRTLKFYNFISHHEVTWSGCAVSGDSVLGVDFGIGRIEPSHAGLYAHKTQCFTHGGRRAGPRRAVLDLAAVTALCKVRTEDFRLLKPQLEELCQGIEQDLQESCTCLIF